MLVPPDFGPTYLETDFSRFPVEPWNTYSNIGFVIVLFIFAKRSKFDFKTHPLTVSALPILLVGFVGGTVFHAMRSQRIWLLLDFIPIIILSLMAAFYFWQRITKSLFLTTLLLVAFAIVPRSLVWNLDLPRGLRITIGYGVLSLSIVLPAIINSMRTSWRHIRLLLVTIITFSTALFFRWFDMNGASQFLPMGSHFLWHILGALSTALMMEYIYRLEITRPADLA